MTMLDSGAAAAPTADQPRQPVVAKLELDPSKWTAEHGTAQAAGGGLAMEAKDDGAALYLEQPLPGAVSYDCVVEFSSKGRGVMAVAGADGIQFPGAERLPSDGASYRAHFQFTVPGKSGEPVVMRVPYIALNEPGARVEIHGVESHKAEG